MPFTKAEPDPHEGGACDAPGEPEQNWTKLTVDNAIGYLKEVKKCLSKDLFWEFLEVIEDFKHRRISTKSVVTKVRLVFEGKPPHLVSGFNMFLPPEYHIKAERFTIALDLVKKIRDRFEKRQPKVLQSFVTILGRFQADTISLADTRQKVQSLFVEHPDILQDFDEFLPMSNSAQLVSSGNEFDDEEGSDALSDMSASSHTYGMQLIPSPASPQHDEGGDKHTPSPQYKGKAAHAGKQQGKWGKAAGVSSKNNQSALGEKRKLSEGEGDWGSSEHAKSDGTGTSKRTRLVSIARLQHMMTVSKNTNVAPHHQQQTIHHHRQQGQQKEAQQASSSRRRKPTPNRLAGSKSGREGGREGGEGEAPRRMEFAKRHLDLIQTDSMSSVIPLMTLQRVQNVLRSIHSNHSSMGMGQRGTFSSFLCRM